MRLERSQLCPRMNEAIYPYACIDGQQEGTSNQQQAIQPKTRFHPKRNVGKRECQ
jgi:hypothetical protein